MSTHSLFSGRFLLAQLVWLCVATAVVGPLAATAGAQPAKSSPKPQVQPKAKPAADKCLAFAQHTPPALIQRASVRLAQLKAHQLKLRYIDHSTFLLTSPKGVTIATDYNDHFRSTVVPVIATMNLAHDTHHSYAPDPKIRHVIRGWNEKGQGKPAIVASPANDADRPSA